MALWLYGKGFILDTLCGKTYAISPRSFYQINHAQTEVPVSYTHLGGVLHAQHSSGGLGVDLLGVLAGQQLETGRTEQSTRCV